MSPVALTRRQHELHAFIVRCIERDGISPSFDEMKDALALRSKANVHRLVSALVDRGAIIRDERRARAIALPGGLTLPDDLSAEIRRRARLAGVQPDTFIRNAMTALAEMRQL